jgi:hypothetical protein
MAAGALAAVMVFGATLLLLAHAGQSPAPLLARSVLFGYSISVAGAFVGAMWAYAYGYLIGAGFAFCYNLAASPSRPPATPAVETRTAADEPSRPTTEQAEAESTDQGA